jgi:hypothetical protein
MQVRASKGKYLSIGPDRVWCPPGGIQTTWFQVTFLVNPYQENPDS